MSLWLRVLVGAIAVSSVVSGSAMAAEHTRVTNPNALSFELLGRGILYSLQYDHVLNDDLAAGLGYGSAPTQNDGATATMIPAYVNWYLLREAGSIYATAGATLVTNSSDVRDRQSTTSSLEFPNTAVLPVFGVGYENRGDAGFLFRFTGYGIFAKRLTPWLGFTFGFAF